ncbi:molybdopterin-guanine dinucleotide biosynthesis protein B [Methylobacterium sp. Leaf118]|uniref:molybdopterin-guanine dinucleotide biosynthesis protein B n=1 Tax=Methylobacterium sp. Leaf118 TaxID=2876562 RepID=UPI001E350E63|nr:molybdopterin-guanine dinucleotide biosynthesis protein B [Methylobacterium sp. Leaf118]
MSGLKVIGLAGWSGAGKTTLLARLIPLLVGRGVRVATLKHAHHGFDIDHPGKDSHVHREAGAREVIVSSARRWAQIREVADGAEARLPDLLRRLTPEGIALVEGFKREAHPKLEVFRAANGRPPLHPDDPHIVGIASDVPFPEAAVPVVGLDDVAAIADLVLARAQPLDAVLTRLEPRPEPR